MKKLFYFAAFAACLLTSCQQVEKEEDLKTPEENESQDKKETPGLVFTATTESSATKTALEEDSGNYNVAWRSGDEITIIDAAATPNVGDTAFKNKKKVKIFFRKLFLPYLQTTSETPV